MGFTTTFLLARVWFVVFHKPTPQFIELQAVFSKQNPCNDIKCQWYDTAAEKRLMIG